MEKNELSVNPQWLRAKAYRKLVFSGQEKIIDWKQVGLIWCYSVFLKLIIISHGSVKRTQKCLSIGQGKRNKSVSDAQSMLAIANERFLDKLPERVCWSDQPCYYDWLKHSGTWVCSLILLSKSHTSCWWNRNLFTTFTKTPPFKEVTQNAFPCMKRHKVNNLCMHWTVASWLDFWCHSVPSCFPKSPTTAY